MRACPQGSAQLVLSLLNAWVVERSCPRPPDRTSRRPTAYILLRVDSCSLYFTTSVQLKIGNPPDGSKKTDPTANYGVVVVYMDRARETTIEIRAQTSASPYTRPAKHARITPRPTGFWQVSALPYPSREIDSPPERRRPLPVAAVSVASGSVITVSGGFVKVRHRYPPLLEYGLNH